MLLENAAGKKTGALAASVTMQTAIVGVILLIPLIYNERLPFIQPAIPLNPPVLSLPPMPEPTQSTETRHASVLHTGATRVFSLPTRVPTTSADAGPIDIDAPPLPLGDSPVGISAGIPIGPIAMHVEAAPRPVAIPKPASAPVPVGGDVQAAKLIRKVVPGYPVLAKQARVSGTVRLIGIIARDGTIQRLQVVAGHPLLIPAAVDAVRQWVYRPTTLNGEIVEVVAPIDVIFTLSQ